MGGLVSAGLLARHGMKVLLLEKESRVGGYVTGFWREGFYFDATGAFVSACGPGGEFQGIVDELGLSKEITFLPIKSIWNIYPSLDLHLDYQGPQSYLEEVKRLFPEHTKALEAYQRLTDQLGKEFMAFETAPWWRKAFLPLSFPALFRYARKSHGEILGALFGDDREVSLVLSALPTTLPPSLLSYAFVAVLWAKVLSKGVFYPKGGMLALSDALAGGIRSNGGQISCQREVTRILTQGKRAVGVRLSDDTEIRARWVVGDINPFQGERLLPKGFQLYKGMHSLNRYHPSLSALIFYIALPPGVLPSGWPYFISVCTSDDLESLVSALREGSMEEGLHMVITTPTVIDPSLAPSEHHSLKVIVHAPPSRRFQENYGSLEAFESLQERVFATIQRYTGLDLKGTALSVESATPMTLLRHTGNEQGAMYGLDAACGQVGPQRPPNRTALDNLLWVGHYTHPAHGIVGSAMSGRFASNIIASSF